MGRNESFGAGASDWRPPEPEPAHEDEPFDLDPEQEAYYAAMAGAQEHADRMAGMSVAERNAYMRGLREVLNSDTPKRGDLDNPLKKDLPKPAPSPRPAPSPKPAPSRSQKLMELSRILDNLARLANGR